MLLQWIAVAKNCNIAVGPFDSKEEARKEVESRHIPEKWTVCALSSPEAARVPM